MSDHDCRKLFGSQEQCRYCRERELRSYSTIGIYMNGKLVPEFTPETVTFSSDGGELVTRHQAAQPSGRS